MISRYKTTISASHKVLLRAGMEPARRCPAVGCPVIMPTVQSQVRLKNNTNHVDFFLLCRGCVFTNMQVHIHVTPRHETTICAPCGNRTHYTLTGRRLPSHHANRAVKIRPHRFPPVEMVAKHHPIQFKYQFDCTVGAVAG
ncbi:hypothetical protein SFRURICE_008000 [Spodoptera frugiperda]|nr:hypothetical protein SFRURICE_008000 [Spodoptera frugiperda]